MRSNGFSCFRAAAFAACVIGIALPAAAQIQERLSSSELHKMMREAHTADQCRTLATWFRGEEATFRGKAEAENTDYERYKTTARTKAPTRADNARSLAGYYSGKADKMAELAIRYESQLSRVDPSYRPVTTTASAAAGTPCPAALPRSEQN